MLAAPGQQQDHSRRLLLHQRQVESVDAAGDWLGQVVARKHVAADRIRAEGVGAGGCLPPVAGGGLLHDLVVEEGRGAIADDRTARHVGCPDGVGVVVQAAAVDSGPVIQDAAARHRRAAGMVVDAAAEAEDAEAHPVGADRAAIHRRGTGIVGDAPPVVHRLLILHSQRQIDLVESLVGDPQLTVENSICIAVCYGSQSGGVDSNR